MTNCYVDMTHPLYGYNAQSKDDNIIVAVNEEIRPCVRQKTSKYIELTEGTGHYYQSKDVPEDQLNCGPVKCLNTGTLWATPTEGKVGAKYRIRSRAENFALGFYAMYLNLTKAGDYTLKVTISDYNDTAQKNAYVYTQSFTAHTAGEHLRVIDLADSTIITQIGTGWKPGQEGIVFNVVIENTDTEKVTTQLGLSSLYIIADRSELRKFTNVLLSCLTSFTHNVTVDATDATCFGRQYDPASIEISKEITATTTSCNDWWLNPLQSMSKKMTSGIPVTDQFTVISKTIDGKEYGYLHLEDLYYEDCNSIFISGDTCSCSIMSNVPLTPGSNLELDEFIVLSQAHYATERGGVLVDKYYIGKDLLVTYNAERDVELIVANEKRLKSTKFRVIQKVVNTRGIEEYFVFNNVLITENSREFGVDGEITLSLTFVVSRDDDGNFYEIRRNMEDF